MARIPTTPMVRFALWAVRIYLLVLLALIGVKFVRVFRQGSAAAPQSVTQPSPAAPSAR
jgi:hypothetical protein